MNHEDARLLAELRAGKLHAMEQFYTQYGESVLQWAIRLGGTNIDAEDVAQEVFLVAFRKLDDFQGRSRLSTWLFGITRGLVANARRRAAIRRCVGLAQIPEPRSTVPLSDEALAMLQRRRQVQRLLERLPVKQREVLVLCDLEERPAAEAAEMLQTKVGTVYSRLHGARRALAALTKEHAPELAPPRLVALEGGAK